MVWFFLLLFAAIVGGLMALTAHYYKECSELLDGYSREWFRKWMWRGAVTPVAVWFLMSWYINRYRVSGMAFNLRIIQLEVVSMPILSYWAAMTFGWLLTDLFKRARNKDDIVIAAVVWFPVMVLVFWVCFHFAKLSGVGFAALLWLWPLTQYCMTTVQVGQAAPAYSKAIGKIKFGKYSEAEMDIIGELEKCESDFDGWMMLAALYANQFHDMREAEKTIYDLCAEPNTSLSQISIALHRLADWHLNLTGNPVAARRALEEICARMPNTHLAMMARNRINQIPVTREELEEKTKVHKVAMPALNESLTEPAQNAEPVNKEAALATANQFVERLNRDPNDMASREKLAKVFAEQLGRFDLASEQLELLAGIPGQPASKLAEWLALKAAWEIRQNGEGDAAKAILERLIREFPQSPQAFAAQRRITLMNMNAKMKARRVEGRG